MRLEDAIEKEGMVLHHIKGISMQPLLRAGKDLIVIYRKPEERLKRYDLPVFKRKNGEYVIHRVLSVHDDGYDICGDNQCFIERDVLDSQIIGVVGQIVRSGRTICVRKDKDCQKLPLWYNIYVHLWCDLFPLRATLVWMEYKLIAIKRRLFSI